MIKMIRKLLRLRSRVCSERTFAIALLGISMTLIIAIVTAYTGSAQYFSSLEALNLDIRQLENTKIDKLLIEQEDGSINLVFHIPADLQINRHLKHASIRTLPPVKYGNSSSSFNVTANPSNNRLSSKSKTVNSSAIIKLPVNQTIKTTTRQPKPTVYPITIGENIYLLNSKYICSKAKNLLFVVLVHSSTVNFQRRNNIRETWANSNLFMNHSMRIVFLLGKPKKDSTQALIEHESRLHRDIIQGNFQDEYHNLTHKGELHRGSYISAPLVADIEDLTRVLMFY